MNASNRSGKPRAGQAFSEEPILAPRVGWVAGEGASGALLVDFEGNRRGPLPLRWVYLHILRELAQHCGHADILREQTLRK